LEFLAAFFPKSDPEQFGQFSFERKTTRKRIKKVIGGSTLIVHPQTDD